jgi:hypothetical protein
MDRGHAASEHGQFVLPPPEQHPASEVNGPFVMRRRNLRNLSTVHHCRVADFVCTRDGV